MALSQYEYQVPLLSPPVAALLGTSVYGGILLLTLLHSPGKLPRDHFLKLKWMKRF